MRRISGNWRILVPIGLLLSLAMLGANLDEPPADQAAPKAYVSWIGPDSGIEERGIVRISDEKEWAALWKRHRPNWHSARRHGPQHPEIDFTQCVVVAVFLGNQHNTDGVTVESVTRDGEALLVRFAESSYQTGPVSDEVTPYGIFVVPRTTGALVLERKCGGGLSNTPVDWEQAKRFAPLKR